VWSCSWLGENGNESSEVEKPCLTDKASRRSPPFKAGKGNAAIEFSKIRRKYFYLVLDRLQVGV
jgi:hypothetical protein